MLNTAQRVENLRKRQRFDTCQSSGVVEFQVEDVDVSFVLAEPLDRWPRMPIGLADLEAFLSINSYVISDKKLHRFTKIIK